MIIKGTKHIEDLSNVTTIAFDKTGTITTGKMKIDTAASYRNKQSLDVLTKEGWGDFATETNADADIIFRTRQQDGIEIEYIIDIDAGIAVFYPTSDEYKDLPRYSQKKLAADELRAVKETAYYYFSEHLEN